MRVVPAVTGLLAQRVGRRPLPETDSGGISTHTNEGTTR